MRGATECARRVKLLFSALRSKLGKVSHPPVSDPITQLILGVLSRDVPEAKASEGLERLRSMVVDYNELRVIPPIELAEVLADFPDARLKCEDIARALNKIFSLEHTIALDRLRELPKRETLAYLERIDGLEPYTRARIRLLGLRQHAIPLDEAMWALAQRERIVAPRCPLAEAQQFLERQIAEEDALDFVALLKRQAWAELGPAVRRGEVSRIRSVPPDRTTRNMLQALSASSPERAAALADDGTEPALRSAGTPADSAGHGTGRGAAPRPAHAKPAARGKPDAGAARTSAARRGHGSAPAARRAPGERRSRAAGAAQRRARKPGRPSRSA